jgi:isopentenyl-diphosphate delta-isomerase
MELFDLVDKNDNVIGVTNKPNAHSNKLVHRCVAVFVFNKTGGLYVQVHKSSGGKLDHTVGGHVSKGESYIEAAIHEAEEEVNLNQPLTELVTSYYSDEGTYIHMFGIFECIAEDSWKFEPNDEVGELVLMSIDEILQSMESNPDKFTGGFINTMKEYRRIKHL